MNRRESFQKALQSSGTTNRALPDESGKPKSWKEFFDLTDKIGVPEDFLSDRNDERPQER